MSARGDVRIELVTTAPDDLGQIPVSAFRNGKSMPIFDRPMLTYLSRPHVKPKQGLEAISLRIDVPVVLAEAWMGKRFRSRRPDATHTPLRSERTPDSALPE